MNGLSFVTEDVNGAAVSSADLFGAHKVTMIIDGEKMTVWECHQIGKMMTP